MPEPEPEPEPLSEAPEPSGPDLSAPSTGESAFVLDARLRADTLDVAPLGLCRLLLMNDARWPWLILVPRRPDATEAHRLSPLDQVLLAHAQGLVAETLPGVTGCASINVAALGNVVRQLHVHVLAREPGAPNWPRPVWGHGEPVPYEPGARDALIEAIRAAL